MYNITALEIITNPKDLLFEISEENGRWFTFLSRGPGHNYKLMISTDEDQTVGSREEAVENIRGGILYLALSVIIPEDDPLMLTIPAAKTREEVVEKLRAMIKYHSRLYDDIMDLEFADKIIGVLGKSNICKTWDI